MPYMDKKKGGKRVKDRIVIVDDEREIGDLVEVYLKMKVMKF